MSRPLSVYPPPCCVCAVANKHCLKAKTAHMKPNSERCAGWPHAKTRMTTDVITVLRPDQSQHYLPIKKEEEEEEEDEAQFPDGRLASSRVCRPVNIA